MPSDPSAPPPDPSLWIIHYSQADPQNRMPINRIQVPEQTRRLMSERLQLQQHGQLMRKEFMLRDRASWPTVNFPGNPPPGFQQQPIGYPGDVISHMNRSSQQAYIQQQQQMHAAQRGIGPSPAKRPRHGTHSLPSATAIPPTMVPQDPALEDEDGGSAGDLMDILTPRDISLHRYVQHHEWLEEILHSPYDTNQIVPGDLGLGKKGELESLTRDFFDSPTAPIATENFKLPGNQHETPIADTATPRVGRLDPGKAEAFTKLANRRVAEINADMERLKRQHERRMAKITKGRAFMEAQDELRSATVGMVNGDSSKAGCKQSHKVENVVTIMESSIGKRVESVPEIECLDKGGLEEKGESQSNNERDYDMVDNLGDYDGNEPQVPLFQQPTMEPIEDQTSHASQSPQISSTAAPAEPSQLQQIEKDANGLVLGQKDHGAEDWVMVSKDGNASSEEPRVGGGESIGNSVDNQATSLENPGAGDEPVDDVGIPDLVQVTGEDNRGNFEVNDFGEGIDFGDLDNGVLDTAGDELANYAQDMDHAGIVEGEAMAEMPDNSAFGDAFPDTEGDVGGEHQTSDS